MSEMSEIAQSWTLNVDAEFSWFFRAEYARVVRAAYVIVQDREAAQDVAQEAFIRLLGHWKKVSRYERPDAWVRRVAIRIAVKTAKRSSRTIDETREVPVHSPELPDPELLAAIRQLPPAQRAAVGLHYIEDYTIVEVAKIMGCSASTARVHLHRARTRLASILGEEVTEDVD
jgi:RNA polymerase sigma-70 factor (ECF subfamily)